jgi:DOPA 4,5-dioxygenase
MKIIERFLSQVKSVFMASSFSGNPTSPLVWPHPIKSYDVHVYWLPSSQKQRQEALKLKEMAQKLFPHLIHGKMWDRPVGPHPYNMFEIGAYHLHWVPCPTQWMQRGMTSIDSQLLHPVYTS